MKLVIQKNSKVTYQFIMWLVNNIIRPIIIRCARSKQLVVATIFLRSLDIVKFKPTRKNLVTAQEVVICAAKNIQVKNTKEAFIITISDTDLLPGTYTKVLLLCNLINNGCLGYSGYPIFTRIFRHVAANLERYYKVYLKQKYLL